MCLSLDIEVLQPEKVSNLKAGLVWKTRDQADFCCFLTIISIYMVGNTLVEGHFVGIYHFTDLFQSIQLTYLFAVLGEKKICCV